MGRDGLRFGARHVALEVPTRWCTMIEQTSGELPRHF